MLNESAKSFVEKFYNDDEFLKDFCKRGGLKKDASDEEKTALAIKTAKEMGFEFNAKEYEEVNVEYFKGKGKKVYNLIF